MSSPPNNASSSVNRFDTMFLRHLMCILLVQDSCNKLTNDDFIFYEEEELEYETEVDKPRPYGYEGLHIIYQEEAYIEAEFVYRILNEKAHTLKPNSGQTIMVRESSIAIAFHLDEEGEYIVWEWHGHIPWYTEDHQYSLEYICGSYFQRIVAEERPPTPPRVDAADLFDGAINPAPGFKNFKFKDDKQKS